MLVTVQMLLRTYAGSGGTAEWSRSGRAGEDGSGLDSEVPSKFQQPRSSIHFFIFLLARSGLLEKKNMISDGDGGNNIDDLGECK
jgi:hypothetical protein